MQQHATCMFFLPSAGLTQVCTRPSMKSIVDTMKSIFLGRILAEFGLF